MGYDLNMRVWRGDATGGGLQDYVVPVEEGEVVLDALHRLQATQAGDLAVRWNCKAGKCGSCSAEVNGKPRLMCMTRLSMYEPDEVIMVTPMRTFPVIRDLVTDVSYNYEKAKEVPAFAPEPRRKDGTYRMQQEDVERVQEFRKCIECFLCQDVCHVLRDREGKEGFVGPRFMIRVAGLEMHPLDTADRVPETKNEYGSGYCNITKCCTEVCPEHINITDNAIIPLKERVVDRYYDPIRIIARKLFLGARGKGEAMAEQFELKNISVDAIGEALVRAEHYRLLNEPEACESICRDILAADPENREATIKLIMSITDQFFGSANPGVNEPRELLAKLDDEFERTYFAGLICEREARAHLERGQYRDFAYDGFRDAMELYEKAEAISPPNNNNAILRYNSCVRTIRSKNLEPPIPDDRELGLD